MFIVGTEFWLVSDTYNIVIVINIIIIIKQYCKLFE